MLFIKKSATTPTSDCVKTTEQSLTSLSPVWQKLLVFLNRHFTPTDAQLVLVEFKRVRAYVKYVVFLNRHYTPKYAHLVFVEFKTVSL